MLKILCVATPDYAKAWQFCIRSQQRFAVKHGYKHAMLSGKIDGLHPKWAKLQYVLEEIQAGNDILMIDADAQIRSFAPSLKTLLANAGDIFCTKGHSGRINSGFMLFRAEKGGCSEGYLQKCLEGRNKPISQENFVTSEGENGHIIEVAQDPRFADKIAIVEPAWNCTSPEGERDAYVLHYTAKLRQKLVHSGVAGANEARTLWERGVASVGRRSRKARVALKARLPVAVSLRVETVAGSSARKGTDASHARCDGKVSRS